MNGVYVESDWCLEYDTHRRKPVRELLLEWCGADASSRFDELGELRQEIRHLTEVAQRAIEALRATGRSAEATKLQRDLSRSVE